MEVIYKICFSESDRSWTIDRDGENVASGVVGINGDTEIDAGALLNDEFIYLLIENAQEV